MHLKRGARLTEQGEEADACGNVGRSQRRKPLEWILGALADPIQRCRDHLSLVSQPIVVDTGAPAHDFLGLQP